VRNYSGSCAAIFTSPLSPAFDLFLYHRPSSSLSPASVFTISDFTKLCASGREHGGQRKVLRPRLALRAEHCLATRIAGRSHSPITAPASHGFWGLKHSIIETVLGSGNRPCADSWLVWGSRSGGADLSPRVNSNLQLPPAGRWPSNCNCYYRWPLRSTATPTNSSSLRIKSVDQIQSRGSQSESGWKNSSREFRAGKIISL
jgi:hypothetical protein